MYKKILVPLDGSEISACSLDHVKDLAMSCRVPEVVLMIVVEPMSSQAVAAYAQAGVDIAGVEKKSDVDAREYLEKLANEFDVPGVKTYAAVVRGNPAEQIMEYADKNNVDLVIMSTRGRSGLSRWVMGSVTDKVVGHSTVPVLTISPAGCREKS
ncbi:universal stress protein [Chloroflexota bacterium]